MKWQKPRGKRVLWTKEERLARQEEMDELHPGYLELQLKLKVVMVAVFFARGFYHALSIMLGQEALSYIFLAPVSIFVGFSLYTFCLQSRGLSGLFFVLRVLELLINLRSTVSYLFYLSFVGKIWWVTLVFCLLLDIGFLGYLTFSRRGGQQINYNQTINSNQVISLRKIIVQTAAATSEEEQEGE